MGRKTIEINVDLLKTCIEEVEAAGPLANLSALYLQVSELMVSRGETNINPQLVMLRINKLTLPVKTQKGKRGRQPGQQVDVGFIPTRKRRVMQEEIYEALKSSTPKKYQGVVEKARTGSLKAVLRLKCLECGDYQQEEIRHCGITSCPLYSIRPFKTTQEKVKPHESLLVS